MQYVYEQYVYTLHNAVSLGRILAYIPLPSALLFSFGINVFSLLFV